MIKENCFHIRRNCDKDNNTWEIIDEKIGEKSKFASIYQTCCSSECDYILKFQKDKIKFEHEIEMHKKIISETPKLVPELLDYFECEVGGAFIIKKKDITLSKALQILNTNESDELKILKAKLNIQNTLRSMVDLLHSYNHIVHNDLHTNNIMCDINIDYDKENDNLEDMFINWMIIDLGESKFIDDFPNKLDAVFKANNDYYYINNII